MIAAMPTPGQAIGSIVRGIQGGLDRMVSVGYGVMYDYIVARFRPYRELHGEVLRLVEDAVPPGASRREVRVLDVGCGPGNFTLGLAVAGFDTVASTPTRASSSWPVRSARRTTSPTWRSATPTSRGAARSPTPASTRW